jgi:hypothetical protein
MMSVMVRTIIIIVILVTNIILSDKGAASEAEIPYGDTTDGRVRNPQINPVLSQLNPVQALIFNFYNTFEYFNTLYVLASQLFF